MASFSMEEFVGNGSLKAIVPKLLDDGWDDVPTLKLMNAEDKDAINMTQKQKDALEIRSYLHDRALMQYADLLEASGKGLPELLSMNVTDLSTQFRLKRGHLARFLDRASSCAQPVSTSPPTVKPKEAPSRMASSASRQSSSVNRKTLSMRAYTRKATGTFEFSVEQSMAELKIKDGHVFKGIVASMPAGPRGCGCVESPQVIEDVAPLSAIDSISVQKLTPEYKIGIDRLVKSTTPPMKALELWRDKTAVILCLRRPGCIMCRAEAHQLYSKKPIFDALGVQLYCIIHEYIETEVKDFWPRYWGGAVIFDRGMGFFKALGGGKLLKDKFISGFLLNSQARANYKRAKATGMQNNFKGEGEIKGGLFIVGRGKTGIAYQFVERNFGDWAPLPEVLEICSRLQNHQQSQSEH